MVNVVSAKFGVAQQVPVASAAMPDIAAVVGEERQRNRCVWRVVAGAVQVLLFEAGLIQRHVAQAADMAHLLCRPAVFGQTFPACAVAYGALAGPRRRLTGDSYPEIGSGLYEFQSGYWQHRMAQKGPRDVDIGRAGDGLQH